MLHVIKKTTIGILFLTAAACTDTMFDRGSQGITGAAGERENRAIDSKAIPGGYRYPTIIEREYISPHDAFSYYKCKAWRIEWPSYANSYDAGLIPTVLSVNNGALNSFNYLNSTSPLNTFNATMSLYYENKLESANSMWDELDHTFDNASDMETVRFAKHTTVWPLNTIMYWVTERPKNFISFWPGIGEGELAYVEGDFIQFHLTEADLYGGVRIVKMSPRIIEVYLALPDPPQ